LQAAALGYKVVRVEGGNNRHSIAVVGYINDT
jgi:hypothetical protein